MSTPRLNISPNGYNHEFLRVCVVCVAFYIEGFCQISEVTQDPSCFTVPLHKTSLKTDVCRDTRGTTRAAAVKSATDAETQKSKHLTIKTALKKVHNTYVAGFALHWHVKANFKAVNVKHSELASPKAN